MPTSTTATTRDADARVAAARTRFALNTLGDRATPRQRAVAALHLQHPGVPLAQLARLSGARVSAEAIPAVLRRLWERAEAGVWMGDNLGVPSGGAR